MKSIQLATFCLAVVLAGCKPAANEPPALGETVEPDSISFGGSGTVSPALVEPRPPSSEHAKRLHREAEEIEQGLRELQAMLRRLQKVADVPPASGHE